MPWCRYLNEKPLQTNHRCSSSAKYGTEVPLEGKETEIAIAIEPGDIENQLAACL